MRAERLLCAGLVAVALAACHYPSPAPPEQRRTLEQAQRTPYGSWINLWTTDGEVSGELLAVEEGAISVSRGGQLVRVVPGKVRRLTLAYHEMDTAGLTALTILGTVSTVSHGFFLILTAPLLWMIPGGATVRATSDDGYRELEGPLVPRTLDQLRVFARFPGGMPSGFDPSGPSLQGGAGQPCYPNRTCNQGLQCAEGTCVAPTVAPPAPPP